MSDKNESFTEIQSDFRDFLKFALKRMLRAIPVLLGIVTIVFILFRVLPGDVAKELAGKYPTPEKIAAIKRKWGLDRPAWEQYLIFIQKLIFEFDLGISYIHSTPVVYELGIRFPATIELTLVSMLLATIIGIPIGIISAYKQHTRVDYLTMVIALIGVSMPIYWLGLMLQDIFAKNLGWFIGSGRINPVLSADLPKYTNFYLIDSFMAGITTGNWTFFNSTVSQLVLPSLALATIPLAVIARMMRSSMLEELRKDYVRTARSKGLKERLVVIKHVTKNAMIPTITVIGLNLGALLAGAVLTETIFSWPGVGKFVWESITKRDSPIIMGFVMIVAFIFVIANMITDIIYAYLDPRVRYHKRD
ncbi:MAG: ABC transporter permease [Candidatus Heimdallarchaeota archaeon]|nr:MAG: ABC transporter permease [Candidatus Heimdallarchaeota archaeon]